MGGWLDAGELRVGLGCMRLTTGGEDAEALALETIGAAVGAGVTVFDTAHSYGPAAPAAGHNERLLAGALRAHHADAARIVTKGGMARSGLRWIADGRARTILTQCEASLETLGGLPIDLYLVHAPDPRVPWRTSVRALRRLLDEKLVRRVGVSNVTSGQLADALELAPIAAAEVSLSVFDDKALRGGVLEACRRAGITLIAHSPLGGPRRGGALARSEELGAVAAELGVSPAQVALAWLLDLSPLVVAIPGARTPESARSAAAAAGIRLEAGHRERLAAAFGIPAPAAGARSRATRARGEVVLIMGIPGAGKSRLAEEYAAAGYTRLNRDERGGSLTELAAAVEAQLASGARRVVLDNTYLTRAARSRIVEAAARHGSASRCVWLDTPLAQAQVNMVERLLDRFETLPSPEELRLAARREPGLHTPTSHMRTLRELEPPSEEEGFTALDRRRFERSARPEALGSAIFVAGGAASAPGLEAALEGVDRGLPSLLFDWIPDAAPEALAEAAARLSALVRGPVEVALCPHPGGPPQCWCRPPLPGLPLAFGRAHQVDPARSILVGTTPTHRTLAAALGARYAGCGA